LKVESLGVYWRSASKRALLFGVMGLCIPKAGKLGGSRAFFVPATREAPVFSNRVKSTGRLFSRFTTIPFSVIITEMSSVFSKKERDPFYTTSGMPRKLKTPLPPLTLGNETVGKRLARFRKERGYTQMELAEKIGIPHRLISDYETGRLHVSDETLARFSIALEVSADSILGLAGNGHEDIKPSLKILRRLNKIASLPPTKQKAFLQTIDALLKVQEK
jgi:transcriptional regulator with XRE-family HTH domain